MAVNIEVRDGTVGKSMMQLKRTLIREGLFKELKKRKIKDSEYQGLRVTTESILKIVKNILSKKLNKMISLELNKFGRIAKRVDGMSLKVIEAKIDAADMDPRITAIFAVVEQKAGNKKRAKELIARAKINGLVPDRIKTWLRGQPAAIKLIEQINEIDSF